MTTRKAEQGGPRAALFHFSFWLLLDCTHGLKRSHLCAGPFHFVIWRADAFISFGARRAPAPRTSPHPHAGKHKKPQNQEGRSHCRGDEISPFHSIFLV
jgi:hypothetical protein